MTTSRTKEIIESIVGDDAAIAMLREQPAEFAKTHSLTDSELGAISRTRVRIVANPLDPASRVDETIYGPYTLGTITIYGGTGPRIKLTDLDRTHLIRVLRRTLVDDDYRAIVREYLCP